MLSLVQRHSEKSGKDWAFMPLLFADGKIKDCILPPSTIELGFGSFEEAKKFEAGINLDDYDLVDAQFDQNGYLQSVAPLAGQKSRSKATQQD